MATWGDLSTECRSAARDLRERGRWRACLNRAYYAIFSEVTRVLHVAGVQMPQGWEGPTHEKVINGTLIANHLGPWLKPEEAGRLISLVSHLYKLRRVADYQPSVDVVRSDADLAFGKMLYALPLLEKVK